MTRKSILIASSDDITVSRLREPLRRSGYDVNVSLDGEAALEAVRRNPQAVAADLALPKLDGMEFCWSVRNRAKMNHLPILIMADAAEKEVELNSYRSGADGFFVKPISVREFMIRLEVIISRFQYLGQTLSGRNCIFDGELGEFMMLELVQWLHNNNKTGRLWLSNMYERGSIYFEEGKIVMARLDSLEGEEAIYRMFGWMVGRFEFEVGELLVRRNIEKSTIEILLECSKQMDEQQHFLSQPTL